MAYSSLILPQADAACGKVFYKDRRTAEGDRVALEVWNRATGRVREGYRLAVCRCRRCGGYHISQRPISTKPKYADFLPDHEAGLEPYELEESAISW